MLNQFCFTEQFSSFLIIIIIFLGLLQSSNIPNFLFRYLYSLSEKVSYSIYVIHFNFIINPDIKNQYSELYRNKNIEEVSYKMFQKHL